MTDTQVAPQTEEYYIGEIRSGLKKSLEGYFQAGKALADAKANLKFPGVKWRYWLATEFQISESYASRLMKVARSPLIAHAQNNTLDQLPHDLTILATLAGVAADYLVGDLHDLTREDAQDLAAQHPDKPQTGQGRPRTPNKAKPLKPTELKQRLEVATRDLALYADVKRDFNAAVEKAATVNEEKIYKGIFESVQTLATHIIEQYIDEDINTLVEILTEHLTKEDIPNTV